MAAPTAEQTKDRSLAHSLARLGRNWVWDVEADRLYLSEELADAYGVASGSFDGSPSQLARLVHPEDALKLERAMSEALQGGSVEPFEYRIVRPDCTQRVVLVKDLRLQAGEAGGNGCLVGVVQDITELRQLQEQLSLLNAELESRVHQRTAELESANTRLQELDRLKSMFIAMTSHELRTPLNSILGFLSMTLHGLSGDLNHEQRDNLSRAYASSLHLLSLVSDVIDISKLEAGKTDAYPEPVELREVVREATDGAQPELTAKGLRLEVEVPCGLTLFTDRKRLLQCLINLIGNAVKFSERGGIRVAARLGVGEVALLVTDTGIGIRAEDLPKLFQPFERLDSPLRIRTGGTGLGLYLTRKLCEDILRGSISIQSVPGKGSTFTMTITRDLREGVQAKGR
ncbi:PAS domain-containing sensor histidine kinase [Geomonas sp.]|uniref:PAS domain-containing sensor histidine kinase n=1 Tax=Geomonas sp. TaxID=2651584 RepID=UPI002B471266|nr:PAS domain-containing sensor histidine kinase [Geomonas sp.]HJV35743.1 PAS domain-containing sensor histidine kinase [Geomonas sp.]